MVSRTIETRFSNLVTISPKTEIEVIVRHLRGRRKTSLNEGVVEGTTVYHTSYSTDSPPKDSKPPMIEKKNGRESKEYDFNMLEKTVFFFEYRKSVTKKKKHTQHKIFAIRMNNSRHTIISFYIKHNH